MLNLWFLSEWTTTLIKFLKDQIPKLAEHYQSAIPGNEKTPPSQSGSLPIQFVNKLFYAILLSLHLFSKIKWMGNLS